MVRKTGSGLAFGTILFGVALCASTAWAQDKFKLNIALDGRVVTTPDTVSFLDGGLGKTRYGHQPRAVEAKLAQAAVVVKFDPRPDLSFRVQGNVDAEHNFKRRVDLVETIVRYFPAITDHLTLDIRGGVFFPTISMENTDLAWLSPYTTSFSAINTWVGEEVRHVGVEAGPSIRFGEAQLRIFGTFARLNDPNGTLLAWRGFAIHDRVTGFSDRLPLPPLKSFDRPDLFPEQPQEVQPLREVDHKWTYSGGAQLTHPHTRIKVMYQPQTSDPGAFDGQQYAWRTGYWAVGIAHNLGPLEVLAQGLDGETRMGLFKDGRNAIVNKFEAAYVMGSFVPPKDPRNRLSVRYDVFRVRDNDDFKIQDANDESGIAWTFAYSFSPNPRHRVTAELVSIDSTRTNRKDLGLDPRSKEILGTLSYRFTF